MAMTRKQIDLALTILRRFETKDLPYSEFGWKYIADAVGVNRTTLYRNDDINERYAVVKKLVSKYKKVARGFDQEIINKTELEIRVEKLQGEIDDLKRQLARERERLAYAQVVARKKDIDPLDFIDNTPLASAITKKFGA